MNSRHLALVCCSLLATLSLGLVGFDHRVSGEDSGPLPSWIDAQPTLEKIKDYSSDEYSEVLLSNCKPVTTYEKSSDQLSVDRDFPDCLTPAIGGSYSSYRGVVADGSKYLQKFKEPAEGGIVYEMMMPVANTNQILFFNRLYYASSNHAYGGLSLHVVKNWQSSFFPRLSSTDIGNIERPRVKPFDFELRDQGGNIIDVANQGISYSKNGEWLNLPLVNRARVLINLETYEIKPYAGATLTYINQVSSVSNNGRYIASTSEGDSLKIYDLNKCGANQGSFISRNCQFKEFGKTVLQNYANTNHITPSSFVINKLEFSGDGNSLDIYASYYDWMLHSDQYGKFRLHIPGIQEQKYLALGDSFSSGEGAYVYRSPTDFYIDDSTYNLCHQSKNSYPYLIQQSQNFDWFNSVACSGARLKDIKSYDAVTDYYEQKPQSLSGVLSDEKASQYTQIFSPGYVSQFEFIRKYHPSVATISIGGNDIGFGDIISTCIINKNVSSGLGQECFKDRKDRELLANQIDQKISALATQYQTIKNSMSGSDPRLYVVGYPQMIRPEGFCGLNVPLLQSEMYEATALTDYINSAIKVAADAAGVRFVNMTNAFVSNTGDYRLCSDKSELAVNGLILLGKSSKKPDQWPYYSESFHPNQLGQAMMADTLKQQTANLTQEMPIAKDSTSSLHDKRVNFVGDDNVLYQNYRITYQKDIAPHLVARGGQVTVDSSNDENDLPAQIGTDVTAILHSEPVEMGHLPITLDGKISGNITIPANTEPGYHKLILHYVDISGNTVERYQFVYIAASDDDWDGDGLSNTNDRCIIIRQSGVDQDNDGVDDACDDEYVKTAAVSSEPSIQTDSSPGLAYSNDSASKVASISQNPIHIGYMDDDSIFYAQTPILLPLGVVKDENKNSDASVKLNEKDSFSFFLTGFGVIAFGVLLAIWLKNRIKS